MRERGRPTPGAVPNGFGVWRPVTRSGHRHRRSDAPLRLSPELDGHPGVRRRCGSGEAAGLRTRTSSSSIRRCRSRDDAVAARLRSTGSRTPRSSARGATRTSSSRVTTPSTCRWASTRRSLGLGQSPDDVVITGAVRAKADWLGNNNATCNFWRGAENLVRRPDVEHRLERGRLGRLPGHAPAPRARPGRRASRRQRRLVERRVHRRLAHRRAARLGIAAAVPDAQRRPELDAARTGTWCSSATGRRRAGAWPSPPYTMTAATPIVREKPFLYLDAAGNYLVMVPGAEEGQRRAQLGERRTAGGAALDRPLLHRQAGDRHRGDDERRARIGQASDAHARHLPPREQPPGIASRAPS